MSCGQEGGSRIQIPASHLISWSRNLSVPTSLHGCEVRLRQWFSTAGS